MYFNNRGIPDELIEKFKLGFGKFYGTTWITIPTYNTEREIQYIKLRHFPEDAPSEYDRPISKYSNFPQGSTTTLFNAATLSGKNECVIVEGELDAILASQYLEMPIVGLPGAGSFKDEWAECLTDKEIIWLWLDNDEAGRRGQAKALETLKTKCPNSTIMGLSSPDGIKDATEYFGAGGTVAELFQKPQHLCGPPLLQDGDTDEMSLDELADVLDLTIKYDRQVKVILFLALLLMYTEADQINVCLLGQSSSGKTYMAQEVASLFPQEDISEYAEVSPTAFKHMSPKLDSKTGKEYVDCERRTLMFTEMPHPGLLSNLRPILSHDKKEVEFLTTDRGKVGGNIAKRTIIRGFPTVVFCSAYTRLNEQEITRCLLLSPEISDEKLEASVELTSERVADPENYKLKVEADEERQRLKRRIKDIKSLNINSVIINEPRKVLSKFREFNPRLAPRSQRDIAHLMSLIKAVAMLNAHHRMDGYGNIVANDSDIEAGLNLWKTISKTQLIGVPPSTYDFYEKYIVPAYLLSKETKKDKPLPHDDGVTYEEVAVFYYEKMGTFFSRDTLRKQVIPTLLAANVITTERSIEDGRRWIIKPQIITS